MTNEDRIKWVFILQSLNKLEIKGQENILLMYDMIGFVQKEIMDIDKQKEV